MKFITEFLKDPLRTGSITPSSRFLTAKMLEPIDFSRANTIVELGAGEGVFTKAILRKMRKNGRLYTVEINPTFVKRLKRIKDRRLFVIQGDAAKLPSILSGTQPDYVVSGLPIGIMPGKEVARIIKAVDKVLGSATFIQFQYTPRWHGLLTRTFNIKTKFTPLNIPPALVYVCRKK